LASRPPRVPPRHRRRRGALGDAGSLGPQTAGVRAAAPPRLQNLSPVGRVRDLCVVRSAATQRLPPLVHEWTCWPPPAPAGRRGWTRFFFFSSLALVLPLVLFAVGPDGGSERREGPHLPCARLRVASAEDDIRRRVLSSRHDFFQSRPHRGLICDEVRIAQDIISCRVARWTLLGFAMG